MENNEKLYLTKEEYEKLLKEISVLKEKATIGFGIKARVTQEGTLDDFDFEESERQNRKLVGQLNEKYELLAKTVIVNKKNDKEIVCINDIVSTEIVFDENNIEKLVFKLVASTTPNVTADIPEYTINSPLGKAILGKKINEVGSYTLSGNNVKVKVLDINNSLVNKIKTK